MRIVNVIVAGPESSGKSALLNSLSDHVFSAPEAVSAGKTGKSCTVDFGRLKLSEASFLYLTAVPADESFQFIWERFADGLLGFIVIFDAQTRSHIGETKELIKRLKQLTDTPFVVALNRATDRQSPEVADLKKELGIPREEQVLCCQATDKDDSKRVLAALLNIGAKQVKKMAGSPA